MDSYLSFHIMAEPVFGEHTELSLPVIHSVVCSISPVDRKSYYRDSYVGAEVLNEPLKLTTSSLKAEYVNFSPSNYMEDIT